MRHLPRLAELEAKLRDTTSGALGDCLAHVDAETRKSYAPQQGSEDGTTTATSETLCWARALKKSRWATSGGAGSLQDEEEKLRTRCLYLFAGTRRIKDGKSCLTEALKGSGGEAGDERGGF